MYVAWVTALPADPVGCLLILLAACQPAAPASVALCDHLASEWGSPTTATPPQDLLLLGMLPVGTSARYTVHYSAEQGSVWV